jgi:hypothetical protein
MILPIVIAVVSTTRGAVRVHRGVQRDDGAMLTMGAVGILLVANLIDRHILHPAETERELARRQLQGEP